MAKQVLDRPGQAPQGLWKKGFSLVSPSNPLFLNKAYDDEDDD